MQTVLQPSRTAFSVNYFLLWISCLGSSVCTNWRKPSFSTTLYGQRSFLQTTIRHSPACKLLRLFLLLLLLWILNFCANVPHSCVKRPREEPWSSDAESRRNLFRAALFLFIRISIFGAGVSILISQKLLPRGQGGLNKAALRIGGQGLDPLEDKLKQRGGGAETSHTNRRRRERSGNQGHQSQGGGDTSKFA